MQPSGDCHTFYVLMRPENEEDLGWEGIELVSEGTFVWAKDVPFRLVLFFMSQSEDFSVSGPEPENL